MVELQNQQSLGRSFARTDRLAQLLPAKAVTGVHLYTREVGDLEVDVRARMYAPFAGVPEDPATGSANCALASLLAHLSDRTDGTFTWRIAQGIEMGRPSLLQATGRKQAGEVSTLRIGGLASLSPRDGCR